MKILHVITSLATGGAEHLMVDLLPRLRDMGNDVELLLFDGTNTPFLEQVKDLGIKVHSLGVGGSVYRPINIIRLVKYFGKYDIIHTHNTACQMFAPVAKCLSFGGAKLITTEHNTTNRRRGRVVFRWIDKAMYSFYERIICISDKTQESLELHIGKKNKIITINNGVDTSNFFCCWNSVEDKLQFVITMVAAFREQKDQDTLIRAMSILPDNYQLQLVGDGPRNSTLYDLTNSLLLTDRINFLGIRTDVPKILEKTDIVVLSSHWEGFGLSAVEGMASARPLIASDVPGLSEVVNGAGVLFPTGDHVVLAKIIKDLCESPNKYKQIAAKCRERAMEFDISKMAINYNKVYQSL